MFISGGRDAKDSFLDDIHLVMLDTMSWTRVATLGITVPRAMHKMLSSKNTLYLFGGYNDKGFVMTLVHTYDVLADEDGSVVNQSKNKVSVRWSRLLG